MNLDNFTLGELKQIAALMNSQLAQPERSTTHPFVGKYVIARCYAAGVHAGTVMSVDGENVVLKDSRRLWSWKAKDGVALSGVAQSGIQAGCKIDVVNPEIYLTGVCELIPTSAVAQKSINDFKNNKFTDGSGDGDGEGSGYGNGNGSGYGDDGEGYGYGNGDGGGNGDGDGDGYGED